MSIETRTRENCDSPTELELHDLRNHAILLHNMVSAKPYDPANFEPTALRIPLELSDKSSLMIETGKHEIAVARLEATEVNRTPAQKVEVIHLPIGGGTLLDGAWFERGTQTLKQSLTSKSDVWYSGPLDEAKLSSAVCSNFSDLIVAAEQCISNEQSLSGQAAVPASKALGRLARFFAFGKKHQA